MRDKNKMIAVAKKMAAEAISKHLQLGFVDTSISRY